MLPPDGYDTVAESRNQVSKLRDNPENGNALNANVHESAHASAHASVHASARASSHASKDQVQVQVHVQVHVRLHVQSHMQLSTCVHAQVHAERLSGGVLSLSFHAAFENETGARGHALKSHRCLLSSVIGAMSCIEHHLQGHSTGMALTWCQAPLIPWYNMLSVSLATPAFKPLHSDD